jgi:predicted MPP superfamily phosphohydrolase
MKSDVCRHKTLPAFQGNMLINYDYLLLFSDSLPFSPDDESYNFLRNVDQILPDYTALDPSRYYSFIALLFGQWSPLGVFLCFGSHSSRLRSVTRQAMPVKYTLVSLHISKQKQIKLNTFDQLYMHVDNLWLQSHMLFFRIVGANSGKGMANFIFVLQIA